MKRYNLLVFCSLIATSMSVSHAAESADTLAIPTVDLGDLVVTAEKNVVKSDGEKLTYDMAEDKSTKGQTLLDALRKVPMVTVDGQDNISINGDSNFKIYVNGKEDMMLESNYQKVFKAMPAESVLKVEVITEPGAQFDAEGSAGILNLITESKQKSDGYSGTLSASVSNAEASGSAFGKIKYHNFSADANITYQQTAFSDQDTYQIREMYNYKDDNNYHQTMDGRQRVSYNYVGAGINAAWEPDFHNLLTFGGNFSRVHGNVVSYRNDVTMRDRSGNITGHYISNLSGNMNMMSASGNASYQHTFADARHRIVAVYHFNFGNTPLHVYGNSHYDSPIIAEGYDENKMQNISREHTFQVDYANPFGGDRHKLETGIKMIMRHNSAFGFSAYGSDADNLTPDPSAESDLRQIQNIYAVYGAYTGMFGPWVAKGGVRYEHTYMGLDFRNSNGTDFHRNLDDMVPNVSLAYNFSPASNLRFGYQMRISRPNIQQLNPYQLTILGNISQEGNPDLRSEHANKLSLTYTNFGRVLGGNIGLEYKYKNNAIEEYMYFKDDVYHYTSANIGHTRDIGLTGFLNYNITPRMSMSVNGRVAYVSMKSFSPDYSNHGFTGNYGVNCNYTAPGDVKISAYGGQNVHMIQLQGHFSGWYYYGIGISRGFLTEKQLNVALNAINFLQKYNNFKSYTSTADSYLINTFKNRNWHISLSVSWNFGRLSSQTRRADLQIDNDDAASGSGAGSGGTGIGL